MNPHKMFTVVTISLVLGVGLWVSPVLGQKVYWIEYHSAEGGPNEIKRANLDGSNAETVIVQELPAPFNIALDLGAGKMYWGEPTSGRIRRADLDGLNTETLLTNTHPAGVALNLSAGKVYWMDTSGGQIRRSNLDGTTEEGVLTGLGNASGVIALDPVGGKIYWTEGSISMDTPRIRRANLDGSDLETLLSGIAENAAGASPHAIALDLTNGKMYWSSGPPWSSIRRANLDGSNVEVLPFGSVNSPFTQFADQIALDPALDRIYWTNGSWVYSAYTHLWGYQAWIYTTTSFQGIALDPAGGKVYLTGYNAKIQRANLNPDYPNLETLIENRTGLANPWSLAFDPVGRFLYWTDLGLNDIHRVNLEGDPLFESIPNRGNGVAVDPVSTWLLYWTQGFYTPGSPGVLRMTFPILSSVQNLTTVGTDPPFGIAIDSSAQEMYWSGSESGSYKIFRSDVNGSNAETLVNTGSSPAYEIALDIAAGKMYWNHRRANLDGSDVETVGSGSVHAVSLDHFSGKKYWTSGSAGTIHRANLDGSQVEDVLLSEGSGVHLRGMALDVDCERRLYGDVDPELGNNAVDVDDILLVLGGFIDPMSNPAADLYPCPPNGDGIIDVDDIQGILAAFVGNASCPHLCR